MEKTSNHAQVLAELASHLNEGRLANLEEVEGLTAELNAYLGLETMQTVLFTAIFESCFEEASLGDIARFFDIPKTKVVAHSKDIGVLLAKRYFIDPEDKLRIKEIKDMKLKVHEAVYDAIVGGTDVTSPQDESVALTRYDFVDSVWKLIDERERKEQPTSVLKMGVRSLELRSKKTDLVTKAKEASPTLRRGSCSTLSAITFARDGTTSTWTS